ncbi:MAG: tRNA-specific adenosine deaminase [Candidatus Poribacteria bacterium]|nr:MAG: tRNA-specific adenosine deaminase [Candidatus Poribacteria bacterium]
MRQALRLAEEAPADDVPVGAVIVLEEAIVGRGVNRREADRDPTAHAEIVALRDAARRLGRWRLDGATLYVTVEPCPMCAGAIWMARISRVVYGVPEPKTGAVHSVMELLAHPRLGRHVPAVGGCLEEECRQLLQRFFATHRAERCESG